jgi:hypothetical protein
VVNCDWQKEQQHRAISSANSHMRRMQRMQGQQMESTTSTVAGLKKRPTGENEKN